jgi:hypothetical protein
MSSNLHVRRALAEQWGVLVQEVATVQAISTAAVEARTDESRVAYLKLLEAETAEMVALVQEVRSGFLGEAS